MSAFVLRGLPFGARPFRYQVARLLLSFSPQAV